MTRTNVALAAAIASGLGAIGATIWVGARVREETVVANPYEEGLRQDDDRRARAALGLALRILDEPLEAGAPLRFALADRAGRPVEDAELDVIVSRPETSRGAVAAQARAEGGGRYAADLALPGPGPWDVRLDVAVPGGRVRLERRVTARAACDLAAGPCARPLEGGGEVVVEIGPRPIRTMREITVRVEVRATATGVAVSFSMPGMEMGENRVVLDRAGAGTFEGKAVLVRCPSGRRDWLVEVDVAGPGAARGTSRLPLTLAEEGR